MTQNERISAMSLEEKADLFYSLCFTCDSCIAEDYCMTRDGPCFQMVLNYLKSEVPK